MKTVFGGGSLDVAVAAFGFFGDFIFREVDVVFEFHVLAAQTAVKFVVHEEFLSSVVVADVFDRSFGHV